MIKAFPFTSEVTYSEKGLPQFDRAVGSDVLRNVFSNYYSNGVFALRNSNCFKVFASNGMTVNVLPGACLINGTTGYDKDSTNLTIPNADGLLSRIDTVAIRFDDNKASRNIKLVVIKGTPSSSPMRPSLTRNGSIYELGIADILVRSNVSIISNAEITDTRLESARCGYVTANPDIDTDSYQTQMQDALKKYLNLVDSAVGGTLAGNIQSQLETLKEKDISIERSLSVLKENLKSLTTKKTVTLSASGWVGKVYTVRDSLITATSNQDVMPVEITNPPTQNDIEYIGLYQSANLVSAGQRNGELYLCALGEVPKQNLNIQVIFENK